MDCFLKCWKIILIIIFMPVLIWGTYMNRDLFLEEWPMLLAVMLSPIVALWISRFIEESRFKKERQLNIFRTLVKHNVCSDHDLDREIVGAINLIYVEFSENARVIAARKELQKFVREVANQGGINVDEEFKKCRVALLIEMAKVLKIKTDPLDFSYGQYAPQVWQNQRNREQDQRNREEKLKDSLQSFLENPVIHVKKL